MLNASNVCTLFVSQQNGSDNYSGFCDKECGDYQGPLKTIETALERIGEMRSAGACHPMRIEILGEYGVKNPIYINNTVENVTICGRENTIVHGGIPITGFCEDTFNGKPCFSASVPQIKEGLWFTDFFVDGVRADMTSIPKNDYFCPLSVENSKPDLFAESKWFIAKPEDMKLFQGLRNIKDCLISYYHYWVDAHSPIESVDFSTGRIEMKYRSRFSIGGHCAGATMRYQLENVAEAFENKNEWYLDRDSAKVYYIPSDESQTPDNICAYAPVSDKLFVVEGTQERQVRGITFSNLVFAYTRGDYASRAVDETFKPIPEDATGYASDSQSVCSAYGALEFRYVHNCAIEQCTIKNIGLHAVTVNEGCDKIRIQGNLFSDIGAGAIKICGGAYGCKKAEETWGNIISQNRIMRCGRRYSAGCGILIMHAYGNIVSHNEISYLYYTGISVGWVWGYCDSIARDNLIEKNHVHHIGQGRLSDMGGIYLLGPQPGTVVRNNIVHDVSGYRYGGTGIYTDEGSSGILIEKNIVYNIQKAAFNQHFGRMNTVRNNIAAKSGFMMKASKPELHTQVVAERNIFVTDGGIAYAFGYRIGSGCFYMIQGNHNLHFDMQNEHKLFVIGEAESGQRSYTLSEVQQQFGLEQGSIVAAPHFVDYENNDFTLKEDSPAFEMGFEKIDTGDVGITTAVGVKNRI